MTVVEIASSTIALLSPYLAKVAEGAAQEVGKNSWEKIKGIYQAICQKFTRDNDEVAKQALIYLEENPVEESRQTALQKLLEAKLDRDIAFRMQLTDLIGSATEGQPVSQFVTQVFGGSVGKIASFGTVHGDVNL